jgi:hypothetical protein
MRAVTPVLAQILGQKARHDHAYAIVHPAGVPQLAHAGINQGNAGSPAPPAIEQHLIGLGPAESVETRIEVFSRRLREVVQQMVGKLAPAQFAQIESVVVLFRQNAGVATVARCHDVPEDRGRGHRRRWRRQRRSRASPARPIRQASSPRAARGPNQCAAAGPDSAKARLVRTGRSEAPTALVTVMPHRAVRAACASTA